MTLRTQLAYAAAVLTLAVGLVALLNPVLAARMLGLEVVAPRGLSEIRSGFGALTLALAGLMLWALPLRPKTAPLLRTLAIVVAAAALGRLASMAIDGVFGPMNLLFLVLQSVVAGALLWASSERPPTRREQRARRETAAARDEAASARIAALEAQRGERSAAADAAGRPRAGADRS
jgi:hypothetical protein